MKKELQDYVWQKLLPEEFKEEVKKVARIYSGRTSALFGGERHIANKFLDEFIGLFGRHNLTSDAEGEEILIVESPLVKEYRQKAKEIEDEALRTYFQRVADKYRGISEAIEMLFGSKCLPDEKQPKQKDCDNPLADKEGCRWRNDGKCAFGSACYFEPLNPQESKSAEPKFKVGELCMRSGDVTRILEYNPKHEFPYTIHVLRMNLKTIASESDLEPYTEPEEPTFTDNCQSQCKGQDHFPDPTKKVDVNRLHVAGMAMAAIISRGKGYDAQEIAVTALEYADALLAECGKGGGE